MIHHFRLLLRNQAQFRRLEGARLRHRVFRAVQAVQNQIAEERVARHPGRVDVLFALVVDEEHMVAAVALRANVPSPSLRISMSLFVPMMVRPSPHLRKPSGVNQSTRK